MWFPLKVSCKKEIASETSEWHLGTSPLNERASRMQIMWFSNAKMLQYTRTGNNIKIIFVSV